MSNKNSDEYEIFYFLVVPGNCEWNDDLLYTCNIWGVEAKNEDHAIKRLKDQVYYILDMVDHYRFHRLYKVPEGRACKILFGGR